MSQAVANSVHSSSHSSWSQKEFCDFWKSSAQAEIQACAKMKHGVAYFFLSTLMPLVYDTSWRLNLWLRALKSVCTCCVWVQQHCTSFHSVVKYNIHPNNIIWVILIVLCDVAYVFLLLFSKNFGIKSILFVFWHERFWVWRFLVWRYNSTFKPIFWLISSHVWSFQARVVC